MIGAVLWSIGASQPVYTDSRAPARLSQALQDRPRDVRFREWYAQLKTYETPHKRLTDLGRGLITLGIGGIACFIMLSLWHGFQGRSRYPLFCVFWLALWAVKVPFSFWYYDLRQERFDYPVWGDSIAIPAGSEAFAWVLGGIISLPVAMLMMTGRVLTPVFRFYRPIGFIAWARLTLLSLWFLLLLFCIGSGIMDGDEGMVFSCVAAMPLLLFITVAEPVASKRQETQPRTEAEGQNAPSLSVSPDSRTATTPAPSQRQI